MFVFSFMFVLSLLLAGCKKLEYCSLGLSRVFRRSRSPLFHGLAADLVWWTLRHNGVLVACLQCHLVLHVSVRDPTGRVEVVFDVSYQTNTNTASFG